MNKEVCVFVNQYITKFPFPLFQRVESSRINPSIRIDFYQLLLAFQIIRFPNIICPGIYRAAHTAHGFLFHSYFHSISPGLVVSNLYVLVSLGWGLLNGIRLLPILIIPSPGWASSRYFRCGSDRPYNSTTLSMSLV